MLLRLWRGCEAVVVLQRKPEVKVGPGRLRCFGARGTAHLQRSRLAVLGDLVSLVTPPSNRIRISWGIT